MRGARAARHYLPRLGVWLLIAALLLLLDRLIPRLVSPYVVQILVFAGCNVILAVSLNLVIGHTGQFSIGHAGLMALGAYSTAKITVTVAPEVPGVMGAGAHGSLCAGGYMIGLMLVGGLAAALGGLVVGLPSLRLRGDYLAIATLGFGEIIRVLLLNIEAVGGARGLTGIPRLSGVFWVFGAAAVTAAALRNLIRSVHGRALLAIREDETAAEALGIDCARYKTVAFVVAAFFAGVAGCLYAHYLQFIHPRGFDFMKSIELVLMVVLGAGSIAGVTAAAVGFTFLPEGLRRVKDILHLPTDPRMVIYAILLVVVMVLRREGFTVRVGRRARGGERVE